MIVQNIVVQNLPICEKQKNRQKTLKNKICQSQGDIPLELLTIEDFPSQISPREKNEKMMDIVERTHDYILINRESKKLEFYIIEIRNQTEIIKK